MGNRNSRLRTRMAAMVLLAAGCGCDDRQEEAHDGLQRSGVEFSVASFLAVAAAGEREAAERFLDAGMHPDAADASGETALLRAAARGQVHVVSLLLERGADAAVERENGGTALLLAATSGDPATVRELLLAGADPDKPDRAGATPLVAAAAAGSAGCAELLVERSSAYGGLALRVAAENGHAAVIDVLLNAGIDPNVVCPEGRVPVVAAAAAGQMEAVKLLVRRGADPAEAARAAAVAAGHESIAGWLALAGRAPDDSAPAAQSPGAPASIAVSIPVAHRPVAEEDSEGVRRMAGLRRPDWRFPGMSALAEVMESAGSVPEKYPFTLEQVARGHKSAVLALTGPSAPTIPVSPGDRIPDTDLVIESLRRRMLYANGKSGDLVDASTMVVRRGRGGAAITVPVKTEVFSGERTAMIRFPETGEVFAARRGDEFRIGSALLRIAETGESGVRVENRLTGESVTLEAPPSRP